MDKVIRVDSRYQSFAKSFEGAYKAMQHIKEEPSDIMIIISCNVENGLDVDKLINKAKKGNERLATQFLQRSIGIQAMEKVIKDLAPRLSDRTSGYTRIIKLGRRFSDNAPMAVMEWVVKKEIKEFPAEKVEKKPEIKKLEAKTSKETKRKDAKK